jgi:hypothetical protein
MMSALDSDDRQRRAARTSRAASPPRQDEISWVLTSYIVAAAIFDRR